MKKTFSIKCWQAYGATGARSHCEDVIYNDYFGDWPCLLQLSIPSYPRPRNSTPGDSSSRDEHMCSPRVVHKNVHGSSRQDTPNEKQIDGGLVNRDMFP